MRIGIFGGTFDPPHVGHLILAAEARDQLNLDQVLWVVTPNPPHKYQWAITPLETRLQLVEAIIQQDTRFRISCVEIDRPGPHYSADTVRILSEENPRSELFYLMGGDSLHDLPTWIRPREFLAALTGIGVMRRPQDFIELPQLERALPGIVAKVHFVNAPLLEISSTSIRERIENNRHFRYFLPDPVYKIIEEKKLYR